MYTTGPCEDRQELDATVRCDEFGKFRPLQCNRTHCWLAQTDTRTHTHAASSLSLLVSGECAGVCNVMGESLQAVCRVIGSQAVLIWMVCMLDVSKTSACRAL